MMDIKPISVVRAAYLNTVLNVLKGTGIEYEKQLRQCNLPSLLAQHPDAYIPLKAVLSFMRWAAYSTGVEDFGLHAASRLTIFDFNVKLLSALQRSSRLEIALQAFCRLAKHEQSNIRYRIVRKQDRVKVCCSLDDIPHSFVNPDLEWLSIMSLVTIVRYFMGEDWMPATIVFQSHNSPGRHARHCFPDVDFRNGQEETAIEFPASLLSLANTGNSLQQAMVVQPGVTTEAPEQVTWDFPTSLQKMLLAYLDDGYPNINFAANIVGSSARTLQRQLRRHNLRYSEIVHQTQIEYAKQLLTDTNLRALDIALTVGYQDASNFARAFRRIVGVNPNQYRNNKCNNLRDGEGNDRFKHDVARKAVY